MSGLTQKILAMKEGGMSAKDISEMLNIDHTDVNRAISRARKQRAKKAAKVVSE